MCTISIIAARSNNNVIGNNNNLPWHLPSDLQHFRKSTQHSVVIMGRKTYESIGKPLPNRLNVIITSQNDLNVPSSVTVTRSPVEALKASRVLCLENKIENIWVIGGTTIYQHFIKRADKMLLTTLDKECQGNIVFPLFKQELWELKSITHHSDSQGYMLDNPQSLGLNYKIEEYERLF